MIKEVLLLLLIVIGNQRSDFGRVRERKTLRL